VTKKRGLNFSGHYTGQFVIPACLSVRMEARKENRSSRVRTMGLLKLWPL